MTGQYLRHCAIARGLSSMGRRDGLLGDLVTLYIMLPKEVSRIDPQIMMVSGPDDLIISFVFCYASARSGTNIYIFYLNTLFLVMILELSDAR